MRLAYHDYGFIIEDDVFIGISLGYDFTSEHEWGIKDMSGYLGIPDLTRRNMGIKSRSCTSKNCKDYLYFAVNGDYAFLIMSRNELPRKNARYSLETKLTEDWAILPRDLQDYKKLIKMNINREHGDARDPIITAWSGGDFGVVVKGKDEKNRLFEIYNAFLDNNMAITHINLGERLFRNSSLSLLLIDRLPELSLQQMKDADREALDIEWVNKKLNLQERLRKTGKFGEYSLHYCGAKFENYDPKKSKKHNARSENLRVWTNSVDYYGWNTVEEIEGLIKDSNLSVEQFKKRHDK